LLSPDKPFKAFYVHCTILNWCKIFYNHLKLILVFENPVIPPKQHLVQQIWIQLGWVLIENPNQANRFHLHIFQGFEDSNKNEIYLLLS
jgi:hypothetical protein